ncbi:hypothetical protein E2C01_024891 [Portunus trituberculatus]|uniref:Uncharacterized protein n=1 Tax=Portunus trituberculatus TaxID=210409 RepID=A0A5B7EE09_PORTR|nr:hypothetical protein [Portunus trituberculatus]
MSEAWKQEKLMRLYDAKKKLLSRVETTFKSPASASGGVLMHYKCDLNKRSQQQWSSKAPVASLSTAAPIMMG